MRPVIHSLHIYPIKSCAGISLESAELTRTGFRFDRHWMLVNRQGEFLSQRTHPRMALLNTKLINQELLVCSTDDPRSQIEIPVQCSTAERIKVKIWGDHCTAARVSTQTSRWFSDFLDTECELVFLPEDEQRLVDREYAADRETVAFADGFPLLIVSEASMHLLNDKLGETLSIDRFRPNIVLHGCAAHAEDDWHSITVNDIRIDLAKPCSRCVIPSIDPSTADKHPTMLRTLSSYRRRADGKIYVGQNGLHKTTGVISKGMPFSFQRK